MKRKQRKMFVLLVLAVIIISYNRIPNQSGASVPSVFSSSTVSTTSNTPVFDPEEEFKRLEKAILMDQEDPEVQQNIRKSREFFEGEGVATSSENASSTKSSDVQGKGSPVSASVEKYYIVEQTDNLSKISKKFYGTSTKWRQILNANALTSERHLKVGMKLLIPSLEPVAQKKMAASSEGTNTTPRSNPTSASLANAREYMTQQGDSLYKIAKKLLSNGSRWKEIYEWNKHVIPDPNNLKTGILLVINK